MLAPMHPPRICHFTGIEDRFGTVQTGTNGLENVLELAGRVTRRTGADGVGGAGASAAMVGVCRIRNAVSGAIYVLTPTIRTPTPYWNW